MATPNDEILDVSVSQGDRGETSLGQRLWRGIARFGRLGPLSLLTLALPAVAGLLLLGYLEPVGEWLKSGGSWGLTLFIAATALFGALSILPTAMLCLLGGWTFGFMVGMPAALLGITLATALGYALARWLAGDRLMIALEGQPKAQAILRAFTQDSFLRNALVVMLLRVSPVVPFAFTNLALAASRVSFPAFAIGTAVGLLPRSAAMAWIGSSLKHLTDSPPDDARWLTYAGVVATLLALVLLSMMARRAVARLAVSPADVAAQPEQSDH